MSCIAAASGSAQAQESGSAPDDELGEITVTGTRITGFTAPTPVTSLSVEELQVKAVRNVADLMQDIPALRVNFNTGQVSAPLGSSNLDLRALGANRTLLLVDGRRFGATDSTGGVDVNVIPTILIRKIDIVTGGASAAYGSDAVSGVVNLFLDDDFDGLKSDVQYGQSKYDDIKQTAASAAFGHGFFDSKLHFVGAVDYTKNTGEEAQSSRPWGANNVAVLNNPAFVAGNGQPQRLLLSNSLLSQMTFGGVTALNSIAALRGIEFLPNGQTRPFVYGTNVGSTFMTGGGGVSVIGDANILPELERTTGYSHVNYDVTDYTRIYVDALFSHATAFGDQTYNTDAGTLVIQRDNAYLPQSIRTILAANPTVQRFNIGRLDTEAGVFNTDVDMKVRRYALGAKGSFLETWKWDVYAQTGRNDYDRLDNNNRITANYLAAVDAVVNPANGQIVCRSTLTNPTNGCVPANVFGQGSISAAAVAYYAGTSWLTQEQKQDVYAFKIDGSPFNTWAGAVVTAFGGEYRKEEISVDSDPISQASGWRQINTQPLNGDFNVKEGFLEIGVPLLKEAPGAYLLNLNGAVRSTDYSTSGSVTTWKGGLNYEPIKDLRFRGTVSRDIRAPNINELYSGQALQIPAIIDPVRNVQRNTNALTGGNPNLTPERALSYTGGVTYQPDYVRGLKVSADYYSIDLKDAIASLSAQDVVNGCYLRGQTSLCNQITRDANGFISRVEALLLNTAQTKTSGIDVEVGYSLDVGAGKIAFRLLSTYVDKLVNTINNVPTDRAGQVGSGAGIPHWRGNLGMNYRAAKYEAGLLYRYVQGGKYDNTFVEGIDINDNSVPGASYIDLNGSYKLTENFDLFAKVNNLLDKDPPATPNTITQTIYASAPFYDRVGRYYIAGARLRF